jgi:methanogenic corrinoid protein MtbC1
MSTEDLHGIVREDEAERRVPKPPEPLTSSSATDILERAQGAVDEMDPHALERVLTRGAMNLSVAVMVDEVVSPLLSRIGTSWRTGRFGPAHEHVATVVIRRFLEWLHATVSVGAGSPVLISATPAGERHELGALLAAVSGGAEGWRTVYLGPDLPADEITTAALRLDATAVAVSCVEGREEETIINEVRDLRRRLPPNIHLFAGGPVAEKNKATLSEEGVDVLASLQGLRRGLQALGRTG